MMTICVIAEGTALAAGRLQVAEHRVTPLLLLHLHSPYWWLFRESLAELGCKEIRDRKAEMR